MSEFKKANFYKVVEALEQKIAVSAYYTVELAVQNIGKTPEDIKEDDFQKLINAILDIYKEYYPHRVADVGNHLSMVLLQDHKVEKKRKKRFFFF